jgi:hypothetical protein
MALETRTPSTRIFPPRRRGQCDCGNSPRSAVRGQIRWRSDRDERIAEQRPRDEAGLELGAGAQRHVVTIALQIDVVGRKMELHTHVRMGVREIANHLEERGVQHRRERHTEGSAHRRVGLADALFGLAYGVERDARVAIEGAARIGESEVAGRPPEEAHAELLLEPRQAAAHRRPRHTELLGGAGERLRVDRAGEGQELGGLGRVLPARARRGGSVGDHWDQKIADADRCLLIVTDRKRAQNHTHVSTMRRIGR